MLFMHAVLKEYEKNIQQFFNSQSKTKKLERATINWYFKKGQSNFQQI